MARCLGFLRILAENLHRRYLTASQRAQMGVEANEWLEDEEGKQWTDSHIAKMCHVHHDTVGKVAISLAESASYSRPTKRKYHNKLNEIAWMLLGIVPSDNKKKGRARFSPLFSIAICLLNADPTRRRLPCHVFYACPNTLLKP